MMKIEWSKQEKELYLPKRQPGIVNVPSMNYFTIKGSGNPNSEQFKNVIGALYALAYTIKMMPKSGFTPEGYYQYTVYPLEGVWEMPDYAKKDFTQLDKNSLIYDLMIRQPDFVTPSLAQSIIESVRIKKPDLPINNVSFKTITEGQCVQMLHIGAYDNEPETFTCMEEFCSENNLVRKSSMHREIYLSNPLRTAPEKLKTALRFEVL